MVMEERRGHAVVSADINFFDLFGMDVVGFDEPHDLRHGGVGQ